MDRNKPILMPFGDGNIVLDYHWAHYYAQCVIEGVRFFQSKNYDRDSLIVQIPLCLQRVLVQIMSIPDDKTGVFSDPYAVKIYGVKCLPGYEACIVIYNPEFACYDNSPLAIIDFDVQSGACQRPVLRFVE